MILNFREAPLSADCIRMGGPGARVTVDGQEIPQAFYIDTDKGEVHSYAVLNEKGCPVTSPAGSLTDDYYYGLGTVDGYTLYAKRWRGKVEVTPGAGMSKCEEWNNRQEAKN